MSLKISMSGSLNIYEKIANEKTNSTQDFIKILEVIYELEEYYSKNLEKISQQISKLIEEQPGTLDLFTILRSYLMIKSEQTSSFAMQLKNTLIQEQQQFLIKQENYNKQLQKFYQANNKECQQNIQTLNQLTQEYRRSIEEEKQYQLNKLQKKKLSYAVSELSIQNFINIYNQYIDATSKEVVNFQDQFKNLEIERKTLLYDTHMKFIIYEISVIRNLQYDLTGISQKLEQYQQNNVGIEQKLNKSFFKEKIDFEAFKREIQEQLNFKPAKLISKMKKPIFDQIKSKNSEYCESIQEESHSYLKIFQNVLLHNSINDDVIKKLNEIMEQALPYSYISCLEQVLQKVISERNQNNNYHNQITHELYLSIQKLLVTLLDHCNNQQEYATVILDACLFAKKLYKVVLIPTENKEIKLSVFEGLMNHQVIQNSQIWVDQAINMKKQPSQKALMINQNQLKNYQIQYQYDEYINLLYQIGCNYQIIENVKIIFNMSNLNDQN